MYKINPTLAEPILNALADEISGGYLIIFAGPEPASPDDQLDMDNQHTHVATITLDGDGVDGLSWDAATGNVLAKVNADVWRGTVTLDGADAGPTIEPSFFRLCSSSDDGRGGYPGTFRLQGSVTGPSGGGDLIIGAPTLTDNGTNTVSIAIANIRLVS